MNPLYILAVLFVLFLASLFWIYKKMKPASHVDSMTTRPYDTMSVMSDEEFERSTVSWHENKSSNASTAAADPQSTNSQDTQSQNSAEQLDNITRRRSDQHKFD